MTVNNVKTLGIIAAMDTEIDGVKAFLNNTNTVNVSGVDFVSGDYNGTKIICAKCGIGKVFAALCTEAMVLNFRPDCIINTGVGGSLTDRLGLLDVAVATKLCQHDMDTSPIGDPKGLISGINKIYFDADENVSNALFEIGQTLGIKTARATIASGDQFIASDDEKERITSEFNADVCEMEGGSIAQVCYVNKVPFSVVRAISDAASDMDFLTFADKAAKNSIAIMIEFIKKISNSR